MISCRAAVSPDAQNLESDRAVCHFRQNHESVVSGRPFRPRHREQLQAQVVVVVVGAEELDVSEVLGRLEDAGDPEARLGGVVVRGGRRAAGEALKLDVSARVEDVK